MFISLIKHNYFLQLVSCLSGLFCSYKLIKLIYKDWRMNQKNLKLLQSSSDFQKIKQEIKHTQLSENQLLSLKNTIINGIIKQDENSKSEQQNQIIKIQNGKLRKMVSYFQIADPSNDRMVVDFKEFDICLDLFRRYSEREEDKYERKINLLGYSSLFSIKLSNFQSIEIETPIVILCDLILNKNTDILRCNRIIKMGTKQSIQYYLKWKIFKNFILFFVLGMVTIGLLNALKFIHDKKRVVKTYLHNATISKGNETQRCGYCKQNVINALFSPCGHFNFCYECSNQYDNCPNCGNYIDDIIKVFKS